MKVCNCGTENNNTARFCTGCGGELPEVRSSWTIRPIWFGIAGMVMYYGGMWLLQLLQNHALGLEVIK